MYKKMGSTNKPTLASQLALIFGNASRLGRYLCCILIGLPNWYIIGVVIFLSPEVAVALGCPEPTKITGAEAIIFAYVGISLGDVSSGVLSQIFRSRKKVLLGFILGTLLVCNLYLSLHAPSPGLIYGFIALLGFGVGYWAIFVTVAAEHFGTNMRATMATTVPNFSRGSIVPMLAAYQFMIQKTDANHPAALGFTSVHALFIIGWVVFILALAGWAGLRETFHDELDYLEK
jgi:hypothetical protein